MTTHVLVTHDGPDHHNVVVMNYDINAAGEAVEAFSTVLSPKESQQFSVYGGRKLIIEEISK